MTNRLCERQLSNQSTQHNFFLCNESDIVTYSFSDEVIHSKDYQQLRTLLDWIALGIYYIHNTYTLQVQ